MNMNVLKGFQDILPKEMEKRRYCELRLTEVFKKWGYQEINTPTLEYYDVLTKGMGPELRSRIYKLLNAHGDIMILRPDMTTPIARIAATKLGKTQDRFHKFYYLNNVFRKGDHHTEEQQEFYQAGIELLGLDNRLADAEVIAVAVRSLMNAGLKDFYIDIGSAKFFNSVMKQLPLGLEYRSILRKTIMNKDFVQLEKLLHRYDLSKEDQGNILRLPHWRGDKSVIEEAQKTFGQKNEMAKVSLGEIEEVYQYLKIFGLEKYILVDLGMIRNFDYYTGIVFEGYTGHIGSAICGGGRYDQLCQKFGKDIPSTGVAIEVENLLKALAQQNQRGVEELDQQKYLIRYRKDLIEVAFNLAEKLRKDNLVVEMELAIDRSRNLAIQHSRDKKIRYMIDIQSHHLNQVRRYDLQTNQEEKVSYE